MVQYNDLNAPPERALADIVAGMRAEARQSKTGAAGVKDLGLSGDVVWTRPDASSFSVRDVDLELADARQRIEDAEEALTETGERVEDAERIVEEAKARLDSVQSVILLSHGDGRQGRADASEAWVFDTTDAPSGAEGSWSVTAAQNSGYPLFPGVEERWAIPVDPVREYLITYWTKNSATGGLHAGQATRYDAGGAVLGTFFLSTNRASGTEWTKHELTITPAQLAGAVRLGFTMYGNVGANRGTFKTGGWSLQAKVGARQVEASEELSTLVVTDSAILNHATLLGTTVVEQINIQDKLIGVDGVFTGTVDFANVNVTGELLAMEISGETIEGVTIRGASISTPSTNGTSILVSNTARDGWPAVAIATPGVTKPAALAAYDGLKVDEGVWPNGTLVMNSGKIGTSGDTSAIAAGTESATIISRSGGGAQTSSVSVEPESINMTGSNANGTLRGTLRLGSSANGNYSSDPQIKAGRGVVALTNSVGIMGVDITGPVWMSANGQGARGDALTLSGKPVATTEIVNFPVSSLWPMQNSPTQIIVTRIPGGRICNARARIQNNSSTTALPAGTWVTINLGPIPSDLRKGDTDYIETRMPQGDARGLVEMAYSINRVRVKSLDTTINWTVGGSIWFDMQWYVPD